MNDHLDRAIEAAQEQRDWLQVTLSSIGDAVVTTDLEGRVTFLNAVAESLTGWTIEEARSKPLEEVFRIINQKTRAKVESPTLRALRDGNTVGLANHTLLIAKDGSERPIDDSAAPIRNRRNEVAGVVLVFRDITERYRQERTIQHTLNYANSILATLREPFLVIDADLCVQMANQAFYESFRITPRETEGRLVYELGNGQWNIPGLHEVLHKAISAGDAVTDYEIEHDFPDLGRRVMLLNALHMRKPGNELVLLAIEDITERKRLQRQNEERSRDARFLAAIVDSSEDAIVSKSLEGVIQTWNAAAERLFGYSAADAVGRHISLLFPADRLGEEDLIIARLQAGERIERYETVRLRSDGRAIDVALTISPIRDESGAVVGASKIVHDISERKRAEAALKLSEVRYRRLFEAATDGILILDFDSGRITDANPYMCGLLGYPCEGFPGKELWEIGVYRDKAACDAALRELRQQRFLRSEHLALQTSRGREIDVEIVAAAYREDHKPVIQFNVRDISERVRMERKLKEQAEALADLHRRKDEFLAMLSHELRNPLAPIANAVQLLQLQADETPLQQSARAIIERQVGQLRRLLDDLLEVSRITTGRVHLRQERIAIHAVVQQALETVRPMIEQHGHQLSMNVPGKPIWLFADAARLEQVIVNLLTNAAKYTNDGGRIELTVQQEGDEAVLRVRDTGVGIAPELLPRIFDLFIQADRSLARSEGGLGIGLALVQRLVELHRGRVEALSTLGRGSEFVVRLPVLLTPATRSVAPTTSAAPAMPQPSLRVLVVDDNVDSTQTLAALLNALEHDVRTAHDGPDALTQVSQFTPDIVFLDIGLPKMDGYEVARRLRQRGELGHTVLVAMTGYGQASDREQSKQAGFDHHLVKPADFQELRDILASVEAN